jgi:hypothetical protein
VLVLALAVPAGASASDKSLKTTLTKWSLQVEGKARGISLSATRRHPARMATKARSFRLTAVRAQHALALQKPTTARGRRAKALALAAFRNYAVVGRDWALSGDARLKGNVSAAADYARRAAGLAKKGNSQLTGAAKLLR